MADVELVIKIDEYTYKLIQDKNYCGILSHEIYNAIQNGTPLSKGHGDIYDYNDLSKLVGEDFRFFLSRLDLNLPQPIIEADKPKRRKGTPLEKNDSGYNCENWIP